jgi:hypothetical protein
MKFTKVLVAGKRVLRAFEDVRAALKAPPTAWKALTRASFQKI